MAEVKKTLHDPKIMRTLPGGYHSMHCLRFASNSKIFVSSPVSFDIRLMHTDETLPTTFRTKNSPRFLTPFEDGVLYTGKKGIRKIDREGDRIFLEIEGGLRGLQYVGPNTIFICKSSHVEKYATSGKKLLEIKLDDPGKRNDRNLQNISINGNGDICVAEYSEADEAKNYAPSLTVVDKYGKYRFSYFPQPSGSPMDLCCDLSYHIIIASKLIHVINKDGYFLRYLNYEGVQEPCSVTIDSEDHLFVSQLDDTS
ncbi:uncharacterized protein LOC134265125, partial [Saccostrea cucullata]|uniref:uncharacterized protein LOC134265125 n=1 Tax=Saccostrea cuccullata TaxID=36930 RepID=UPI002ED377DC